MDTTALLQALQSQSDEDALLAALVQAPQHSANDVMEMKLRSMMQGQKADDWRSRGTYDYGGPLAGATRWINRNQADKYQEKALRSLTQAMNAQSGIDQYQAQMERLRAAIAAQQEFDQQKALESHKAGLKDNTPNSIRELQAMGIDPASPEGRAYLSNKGSGVTVNMPANGLPETLTTGLANQGFMWDGEKLVPIPGGPAEKANEEANRKDTGRKAMIERAGTTVVQDLGRAKGLMQDLIPMDGMTGANARIARSKIAGSPEWTFVKHIESAKSNIGLDRLQQMRENSPTGGALGQVPFKQQQRLEQVYGEVDVGMDLPTIEANINRIQNIYTDIMYGSPQERALAVKEGRMTQEESDWVDSMYLDVPFDIMGDSKESPESEYERWKKEKGLQ